MVATVKINDEAVQRSPTKKEIVISLDILSILDSE